MSNPLSAKCCCESCGVHLEFPLEAAGSRIACPSCGQSTELGAVPVETAASSPDSGAAELTAGEIINAFTRRTPPTPVSVLYQAGLLFVTVAMVLLPVLYVAMVAAAAWLVYFWATHFKFLLTTRPGGQRARR